MSAYTTALRREVAAEVSKFKPGQTLWFQNPGIYVAEVKIEFVDLCYVNASGNYSMEDFNENALEYSVMILSKAGFAHTRIRARSHELSTESWSGAMVQS